MGKRIDMTGEVYGRLTVIEYSHSDGKHSYWKCKCSCGDTALVSRDALKQGRTVSCGCYKKEFNSQQWQDDEFRQMHSERMKKQNEERWSDTEEHKKASDKMKEVWQQDGYCEHVSQAMKENWKHRDSDRERYRQKFIGKSNPNYNDNLTEEERQKERDKEWVKNIYEREDYTCEKCGQRGGKLNAHHKNGHSWCKTQRSDIDNGACLCESCHKKFHKKYGYKYNTEEQYIAFLITEENE